MAPFIPPLPSPRSPYLLPPYNPPLISPEKKERGRALSVAVGGIRKLYLGERW